MPVVASSEAGGAGPGVVFFTRLKQRAANLADNARAAAQAAKFARQNKDAVVTEVGDASSLTSIPLHQQGDAALSSPEAFKLRSKLRRNMSVLASLNKWWEAALSSARVSRPEATDLSRDDYVKVYRAISVELLEEDFDEAEAEAEALEEWAKDSGNASSMEQKQFFDAIFEICDMYCMTLEASEYASFSNELLTSVVDAGIIGERSESRARNARLTWDDALDVGGAKSRKKKGRSTARRAGGKGQGLKLGEQKSSDGAASSTAKVGPGNAASATAAKNGKGSARLASGATRATAFAVSLKVDSVAQPAKPMIKPESRASPSPPRRPSPLPESPDSSSRRPNAPPESSDSSSPPSPRPNDHVRAGVRPWLVSSSGSNGWDAMAADTSGSASPPRPLPDDRGRPWLVSSSGKYGWDAMAPDTSGASGDGAHHRRDANKWHPVGAIPTRRGSLDTDDSFSSSGSPGGWSVGGSPLGARAHRSHGDSSGHCAPAAVWPCDRARSMSSPSLAKSGGRVSTLLQATSKRGSQPPTPPSTPARLSTPDAIAYKRNFITFSQQHSLRALGGLNGVVDHPTANSIHPSVTDQRLKLMSAGVVLGSALQSRSASTPSFRPSLMNTSADVHKMKSPSFTVPPLRIPVDSEPRPRIAQSQNRRGFASQSRVDPIIQLRPIRGLPLHVDT